MNYLEKFKLKGKTAMVTGGTGLIGREVSRALAQAEAKVIILDLERNRKLEEEIKKEGGKTEFVTFDITDMDNYENKVRELFEKEDIHILVNTAYPRTKDWGDKLEEVKADSWHKNVEIQMSSYCLLSKEIAKNMKEKGIEGSIINFGSTYGIVGPDFSIYPEDMTMPAAYSAIKGGVINFCRYLASYYGSSGIRVNCLCPGGVYNNHTDEFVKNYSEKTPLGRMAKPEEIATTALFLASEASSYITGATIIVDGGWTCI